MTTTSIDEAAIERAYRTLAASISETTSASGGSGGHGSGAAFLRNTQTG